MHKGGNAALNHLIRREGNHAMWNVECGLLKIKYVCLACTVHTYKLHKNGFIIDFKQDFGMLNGRREDVFRDERRLHVTGARGARDPVVLFQDARAQVVLKRDAHVLLRVQGQVIKVRLL